MKMMVVLVAQALGLRTTGGILDNDLAETERLQRHCQPGGHSLE